MEPSSHPIADAPVKAGEKFGPCLLQLPDSEANFPDTPWEVGGWDGQDWAVLDGVVVHPTHWARLPDVSR
jgi:hypothetical protein